MNHSDKASVLHSYCSLGWRLLPTWGVVDTDGVKQCECEKGDKCPKPGKHPRIKAWQHQATNEFNTVLQWHNAYPGANWGWVQDRTFAIDIDTDRLGFESLMEWEAVNGGPPKTLTQFTANEGLHFIYHQPTKPLPQVGDFMVGIEVRGTRSYIMIAPSRGLKNSWRWRETPTPGSIQHIDEETLTLIHQKMNRMGAAKTSKYREKSELPSINEFLKKGFGFFSGSRNQDAYRMSWRLLALSEIHPLAWDFKHVVWTMQDIWKVTPQGDHPFTWEECIACTESAYKRRTYQKAQEEQASRDKLMCIQLGSSFDAS